jgi:hypothetical protein
MNMKTTEEPKERTEAQMDKLKVHCGGCYNDVYNYGCGGAKRCWSLRTMKLKMRKQVHINDVPPWKHKPRKLPDCYCIPQFVFVDADRTH